MADLYSQIGSINGRVEFGSTRHGFIFRVKPKGDKWSPFVELTLTQVRQLAVSMLMDVGTTEKERKLLGL